MFSWVERKQIFVAASLTITSRDVSCARLPLGRCDRAEKLVVVISSGAKGPSVCGLIDKKMLTLFKVMDYKCCANAEANQLQAPEPGASA